MGPIASLAQDDPYLRMPREERLALHRERRSRIRHFVPPVVARPKALFIPNTPYGVKKVKPRSPTFPVKPIDRVWWPNMWFWDLVFDDSPTPAEPVTIDLIMRTAATFYGFTKIDLQSIRRHAPLVRCRQVAMYLCKTMTLRSYPEIGRRFGGRDHTTAIFAVRKIEGLLSHDEVLTVQVGQLRRMLAA